MRAASLLGKSTNALRPAAWSSRNLLPRRTFASAKVTKMGFVLGDKFPDFKAETNEGTIDSFHKWMGDSWAMVFSHPRDFTPVCTTELSRAAQLAPEFEKRNVKMIALSLDSAESHREWVPDVMAYCKKSDCPQAKACCPGGKFPYPIIADEDRSLATRFGMLDPDEVDEDGKTLTARCVFVVGPEKTLKLSVLYPATTGRNFDELIRVIDSLQLTATKKVCTPADWKQGGDCVVIPSLSDAEAAKLFGPDVKTVDLPSGKRYLRMVAQPK